jgi:hypothetical protein
MVDDPNDAGGAGDGVQKGNEGGGGNEGSGGGDGDQKWYEQVSADDVITTSKLQGIIKASEAKTAKEIQSAVDKATAKLPESIKSTVQEAMKASLTKEGESGKGDGKNDEAAQELAALKRKLDEAQKEISGLQTNLKGEQEAAQSMKKRGLIMEQLSKAKCTKPEAVYEIIKNRVTFDTEKGEAYVLQDNGFGADEQRSLEDFISKEIRIDELPELFQGANRPGSPATGDQSTGGGNFKYDYNRVKNDPQVLASDEFMKALDAGQVANVPT